MTTPTPPLADTLTTELREMANDTTIFAGSMYRESALHVAADDRGYMHLHCEQCGNPWPCPFRQVYDYAERLAGKAADAASELRRLAEVERERDVWQARAGMMGWKGFIAASGWTDNTEGR